MDISKVKYSIIVPHYNDEEGLFRLLKSVPPRDDIQVLVIDDRSNTEKFKQVVNESRLPNVSYFVNDRVKSAGSCRNIGLRESKGEYLIFADSDDFFVENAFISIDKKVLSNPEADVIFFNTTSLNDAGEVTSRHLNTSNLVHDFIHEPNELNEAKIRFTHYVPWGKIVKKSLIEMRQISFDQTIIANDGVFSLKIGKSACEISASSAVIYCVTLTNSSLTQVVDLKKYRVRLEVYVRYYHLLSDKERRMISTSPLPLLYLGRLYGFGEILRSILFFRKNRVPLFKYFKLRKRYFYKLLRK